MSYENSNKQSASQSTKVSTKYYNTYKKPLKSYTFSSYDAKCRGYKPIIDKLRNTKQEENNDKKNCLFDESSTNLTISTTLIDDSNLSLKCDEKILNNINEKIKENERIYNRSKIIENKFEEITNSKYGMSTLVTLKASVKRSHSLQSNDFN